VSSVEFNNERQKWKKIKWTGWYMLSLGSIERYRPAWAAYIVGPCLKTEEKSKFLKKGMGKKLQFVVYQM
jgi:hypothetical protein